MSEEPKTQAQQWKDKCKDMTADDLKKELANKIKETIRQGTEQKGD